MPSLYGLSETISNFLGMVGLGQKTKANSLSVALASDQDPLAVTAAAASQADGHSATLGATTDAAVTTDTTGSVSARLRGLVNLLAARLPAALATNGGLKVEPTAAAYNADTVMQAGATGNGNGTAMDVSGMAAVAVQATGFGAATINWEGTIDGQNWVTLVFANLNGSGPVAFATATANGIYGRSVAGLKQIRARLSGYGSGTITVTGHAVAASDLAAYMPLPVSLYRSDGNVPASNTNADGVGAAGTVLPIAGSLPSLYNGAGLNSWDRARNNTDLALLASAARTLTTASPDQTNYNGRSLLLFVNVSNIGTGSITPSLQVKDSISGDYFTIWTATAALTANGDYVYYFSDGAAGGSFTEKLAFGLPARTWRVNVTANNANSAVYSVSGVTRV